MRIKKNVPVSPDEQRKEWPLKKMDINSVVDVKERDEYRTLAHYAHSFAAKQEPRWRFKTKWMGAFGRVRRVE